MPNLISQEVYDETIAILEGRKQPDIVLKRMQEWYGQQGVTLYNLYLEKDYCEKTETLESLTDLHEGFFRKNKWNYIYRDSLKMYCKICTEEGIPIKNIDNFAKPEPGINGFYFPRIWRGEIITEVGETICPVLEKKYKDNGVEKVVNSGYGGYTVFTCDRGVTDEIKAQILDMVTKEIKKYDKHGVVGKYDTILNFDKLSILRDVYNWNYYQYYK
ncbi:hypothetical protein QA584_04755 [Anaerocolumna sp. AGMB13025]|uniref:hypothetical protein n=1 Tax=Anaerocolumna sp. AGMB13025 TaxID=3039116 RepID=UPI00241D7756|nr:hypothetical protein [Anaerocolumna sp. AGMB13025]WFR58383.1 hypothetical protein QA584_04755 [Anaerocolumna sp. AGMB13025]